MPATLVFELEIFRSMEERGMDHLMSVQLEKLTKLLEFLMKTCKLAGETPLGTLVSIAVN